MTGVVIHNGVYNIRPAGRHLLTIGADLIKDKYAAVVELVKNSYDADSKKVTIRFSGASAEANQVSIEVCDTGDGMTFDKVVNQWMVPSTDDKVQHSVSAGGRVRQGSKGVGRYAASILGNELLLETVTPNGELTTLYLVWDAFREADFLQDVDILVETVSTDRPKGTSIRMIGSDIWTKNELTSLLFELRKLVAPTPEEEAEEVAAPTRIERDFAITVEFAHSWPGMFAGEVWEVIPFPIVRFSDYQIKGQVSAGGVAKISYYNNRLPDQEESHFETKITLPDDSKNDLSFCGPIQFDFRVYDREPQAIQSLLDRGMRDPDSNEPISRRNAAALLKQYSGIGVYRNGFRIRPLGDAGFDWLSLDSRRVQQPSLRIGSDQVIGFIRVASEVESGLQEKSARDGIKETSAYFGLIEISHQVLAALETRRFNFRLKSGLGRSQRTAVEQVDNLFRLENLKRRVEKTLVSGGVDQKTQQRIIRLIDAQQQANTKAANALKRIVAIYQGQATIGKIINIVLHEGRRPISYFNNAASYITKAAGFLARKFDIVLLNEVVEKAKGFETQSKLLTALFARLDPLAARRGDKKAEFRIRSVIETVLAVFQNEILESDISVSINCPDNATFTGWITDFNSALTNLVDNSIYWLKTVDSPRHISFKVTQTQDLLRIQYRDNGPGILEEYIRSQVIFEPEFTTKTEAGSGLGLAIAGEAINRNGGRLSAEDPEDEAGVLFQIQFLTK